MPNTTENMPGNDLPALSGRGIKVVSPFEWRYGDLKNEYKLRLIFLGSAEVEHSTGMPDSVFFRSGIIIFVHLPQHLSFSYEFFGSSLFFSCLVFLQK